MKIAIRVIETKKRKIYPHRKELRVLGCIWWKDTLEDSWIWFGDTDGDKYQEIARGIYNMGLKVFPYFGGIGEDYILGREINRDGIYYRSAKYLDSQEKEIGREFYAKRWSSGILR